jgi:regulator of protease activity HflC (stomatin/prohibitin superfamily)
VIPVLDKIVKTNLQINAVAVQPQSVITKDNVTVQVDAVAYMQVVDAAASVVRIRDWYYSAQLVAQTTLRAVTGRHELDQILSERDAINAQLQQALDEQTEPWGVKVHRVEIRDVALPESMQRAMAHQAEAERDRRAKIVAAEGELQASEKLAAAAHTISSAPGALQLRQLQSMVEISAENNSTIVFPIPIEIMEAVSGIGRAFDRAAGLGNGAAAAPAAAPSVGNGSTAGGELPPAPPPAAPQPPD